MLLDSIDVTKVQAHGPWVLLEVEEPRKVTEGGLYLPDGNLYERIGYAVGKVVSAGRGFKDTLPGRTKRGFLATEVDPGDRVLFRGHMKNANQIGDRCCFVHVRDLLGVLDKDAELELALPYNN